MMFNKAFDIPQRISKKNTHFMRKIRFSSLVLSETFCCINKHLIHRHIFSIPKLLHKSPVIRIHQLPVKGLLAKHEPYLAFFTMFKAPHLQACCFNQRFQRLSVALLNNQQVWGLDTKNNRCTLLCCFFLYSSYYFIRLPVCNHPFTLLYLVRYT